MVMTIGIVTEIVKADLIFGEPTNLGPMVNSSEYEYDSSISTDELELYFHSTRPGGYGNCDLWVTTRATIEQAWGKPVNLGPDLNTSNFEGTPCISADGLSLYFSAYGLPGGQGNADIWRTSRATKSEPWGPPENLGSIINTLSIEGHPNISSDGLSLYCADVLAFGDTPRPEGYGRGDIWISTKQTTERIPNGYWGALQNLGATINSSAYDAAPCI